MTIPAGAAGAVAETNRPRPAAPERVHYGEIMTTGTALRHTRIGDPALL